LGSRRSRIEKRGEGKDYVKRERHIATRFISEDESEKAVVKAVRVKKIIVWSAGPTKSTLSPQKREGQ
jgi:hypothetical protein